MKSSIVCASVLLSSVAFAGNAPAVPVENTSPHHFHFGPGFLSYHLNKRVNGIPVGGQLTFYGSILGYDYIKSDSIYAGVHLLGVSSRNDFDAGSNGYSTFLPKSDRLFANLEGRFGYTFSQDNWVCSPFLGLGTYETASLDRHNEIGFKQSLPYIAAGARSSYVINETFNLGLNLKIFHAGNGQDTFNFYSGKTEQTNQAWGGEVAVPFTWHIGSTNKWDFKLEPFFLKMDFSETQNLYGTNATFSYRF